MSDRTIAWEVQKIVFQGRSLLSRTQQFEYLKSVLRPDLEPSRKEPNEASQTPRKEPKLPKHCRQIPFGCDCGRDDGFRSICKVGCRALRRVDEVQRRQVRPRLLLVRTKAGAKLVVETPKNNSVIVEIYDSVLQAVKAQRLSVQLRASKIGESEVAVEVPKTSQLLASKLPLAFVPAFYPNASSVAHEFSAKRLGRQGWKGWREVDTADTVPTVSRSPLNFLASQLQQSVVTGPCDFQIRNSKEAQNAVNRSGTLTNDFAIETLSGRSADDAVKVSRRTAERARATNLDTIRKDVRRTFQTDKYFKNPPVLSAIQSILEATSDKNIDIGYVQGMNYIIGGVVYHCAHADSAMRILDFLFANLELRKVFNLATFETFVGVTRALLKVHLLEFFFYFDQIVQTDFKVLLLDWFFCLGFNKVPLAESGLLLLHLTRSGWFYFFRLLICYFKVFDDRNKRHLHSIRSAQAKFELQVALKNFFKERIDWGAILRSAAEFPLKDALVEESLGWTKRNLFERPGKVKV